MTDHKITDDELQRCIECCIKGKVWGDCKKLNCPAIRKQGCHFYLRTDDDYENTIYIEILKDALALIYNQKAKIEALQMDNEQLQSDIVNANMNLDHAQAEIERLQAVHADMTESLRLAAEANKDMQAELADLREIVFMDRSEAIKNLKAEAIKEFAQRLIKKCDAPHWCVWMNEIEDLVEEMTENKR